MVNDKICFVISPIGEEGSDIRKLSDLIFDHIIKPIVQDFGYKPIRADHINESGMITNQIIEYIINSSLVIADLTDYNPNVFYELAVRHIVGKPYIHMMYSKQKIPFDIYGMRTIPFDIHIEQADRAKKYLSEQIKSIENHNFKAINPITLAINYSAAQKMIKESGTDESIDSTKVVLESVTELRSMIDNIAIDIHNIAQFSKDKESEEWDCRDDILTKANQDYVQTNSKCFGRDAIITLTPVSLEQRIDVNGIKLTLKYADNNEISDATILTFRKGDKSIGNYREIGKYEYGDLKRKITLRNKASLSFYDILAISLEENYVGKEIFSETIIFYVDSCFKKNRKKSLFEF